MLVQIDLEALANYVSEVVDCSADYEDDQFGIRLDGQAMYVERHPDCYRVEVAGEVLELPR